MARDSVIAKVMINFFKPRQYNIVIMIGNTLRLLLRYCIILFLFIIVFKLFKSKCDYSLFHDEDMMNLICQLDIYKSLAYAVFPVVLICFFIPDSKLFKLQSYVLFILSTVIGLFCSFLIWSGPTWSRPDLRLMDSPIYPAIVIGVNVFGLIWCHAGGRWTKISRNIILYGIIISDILLPLLLWSAYKRKKSGLFVVPRILAVSWLSLIPFIPWITNPIPNKSPNEVDSVFRNITSDIYYHVEVDAEDGELILVDDSMTRGKIVRFDPNDGTTKAQYWTDKEGEAPTRTQVVAFDVKSRNLIFLEPMDGYTCFLDIGRLSLEKQTALDKKVDTIGCRTYWDSDSEILAAFCARGVVRASADGSKVLSYYLSENGSDAVVDPNRKEIHLITWSPELIALDAETLLQTRSLNIRPYPDRVVLDEKRYRLLVSHPLSGVITVVDLDTYTQIREVRTFPGARVMAIHEDKNWLLIGGLSPVFEIRSLDDFRLINRFNAPHWIRWIAIDQARDRAYITSGSHGVWALDLKYIDNGLLSSLWRRYDPFYLFVLPISDIAQRFLLRIHSN